MERGQVIREKILKNGKYTVKFIKESKDTNRVEIFEDDFKSCHFYVSKDFGNYYYKVLKGCECWAPSLLDLFFLDSIAYDDNYDFYSDVYKDIHGRRPHYTESQWNSLVAGVRHLKPQAVKTA